MGLLASHYFRSLLIPCSLYIDDRHTGEIQLSPKASSYASLSSDADRSFALACSAVFVVCYTLVDLGYFIGFEKSHLVPKQVVPHLGFLVDSVHQACLLLEEKKQKFLSLLRSVLSSTSTDLKTLQCLRKVYFLLFGNSRRSSLSQ